jgi:hypothetical protein
MVSSVRNDQVCIDIPAHYLSNAEDGEFAKKTTLGCLDSRIRDNLLRVVGAGGLSFIGAMLAGFYPTTLGIIGGAVFSGVGNATSLYLSWETKNEKLIKARYIRDLPALMTGVDVIEQKFARVIEKIEMLFGITMEDVEAEIGPISTPLGEERPEHTACFRYRAQRNLIRILTPGCITAVGGWVGGFSKSAMGVTVGSLLSGIGNGFSAGLALEKKNEEAIQEHALNTIPQLFEIAQEAERKLVDLIERIQELHPETILDFSDIEGAVNQVEHHPHERAKRMAKNITYLNIAGWLSGLGGLIVGFEPNTAGIFIGGAIGGAANSISTGLTWERGNDREVIRTEVEDFSSLVLKIVSLAAKIQVLHEWIHPEAESSSYSV